jgi:endonuclease YncB( thermonuclease family)
MSAHAGSTRAVVRGVGEVRESADFNEVKVANGLARAVK